MTTRQKKRCKADDLDSSEMKNVNAELLYLHSYADISNLATNNSIKMIPSLLKRNTDERALL